MALARGRFLAGVVLCGIAFGGCSGSSSGPVPPPPPPPATKLAFIGAPSNAVAGAANTPAVRVAVQDAQGNTVTTATTSITVAIGTNPASGTLSGTTTIAAVSGVATFSTLSLNRAAAGYTLTASATGLTGTTSGAFNIGAGAAAQLAVTVQPSNAVAGAASTPAMQVAVQDAESNTVTTATTSITVAIGTNPASGTLSGTTTVAAVNGVATFSTLSLNTVGSGYTLTATATGLTGATSNAFNIGVGAAAKLVFIVPPSNAVAGTAFTPAVQVAVHDAQGNTVTTAATSITVAIGTNPGSGTLIGTTTAAAVSGVATFATLRLNTAGTGYTLTASATGLTGATSTAINISPSVASTIAVSAGNNQATRAGTAVATAPTVRVADQYGNGVAGTSVTFVVTAGDGSVTGATQTTASDGTATLGGWTLGASAAVNRVEARVAGISPAVIEARSWTISPVSIALTSIGESQSVTAAVGDSTGTGSLTLSAESRWLQEIAVADGASLQAGIVRATAPGSARVHVRAFGLDLGDVLVSVVPTAPIVFSVQQPGWPRDPTLVVRGYAMNALPTGAVLVGSSPATKITADSAQFTASPGISSSTACVLSVTDTIAVPGFTVLSQWTARRFTAVQAFAVGDALTMQGGSFCLKLPPQVASYAIAQVDRSLMDRAVTAPELYQDTVSPSPYTFSTSDQNGAATAAASARRPASAVSARARSNQPSVAPPDIRTVAAAASATDIFQQPTPWVVGDLISTPGFGYVDIPWRVMRIYPGNFVLAISQTDSALLWTPAVIASFDTAFTFLLGSAGQSIYQTTFSGSVPTTSAGSGQYLVLLQGVQGGSIMCNLSGGPLPTSTGMLLGSDNVGVLPGQPDFYDVPALTLLEVMAHEYTHSWDCLRTGFQSARWAQEGIADFFQSEMGRLFSGLPVDGNAALDAAGFSSLPQIGQFQNGYGESESFMRHLAWRLNSLYGVPWEQARATVVLGSSEGWYGRGSLGNCVGLCRQAPPAGPGLVARVRQVAGSQWEPVDARLDWVLSLAADDRVMGAAASYGYAFTFQTWQELESPFRPFSLAGWSFYRGTIVAGAGQSISGTARADDNGYVLINDPSGLGAALELRSSIGSMVWRVLRYR